MLHISDLVLGNPNYRRETREANAGRDLIDLDRQAALDRAVGCALEHDVDLLLVSGGLIDGRGNPATYRDWLDTRFHQLHAAGITPVIYDPLSAIDGADAVLLGDEHIATAAGATFAPLALAVERAAAHPDELVIAVGHGCVPGIGGSATFERELDDRAIMQAAGSCAYVALGGMLECQPVAPNAWYSGSPCGLFAFHPGTPGGIIVQLGRTTREVLDLIHVQFDCRRRVSVSLDAGGMSCDQLAGALHRRLDPICFAVDPHHAMDDDHPLSMLYGGACDRNEIGWWSRPVINLKVTHADCTLPEVLGASPLLRQMLCDGEHLLVNVAWTEEGAGGPRKSKFVPSRA
jgi:hypothetical protein